MIQTYGHFAPVKHTTYCEQAQRRGSHISIEVMRICGVNQCRSNTILPRTDKLQYLRIPHIEI